MAPEGKWSFGSPVIERCQNKLATWKATFLSFGGHITLIKAALSNLPIYFVYIFKILKGISRGIESLQNHFLW